MPLNLQFTVSVARSSNLTHVSYLLGQLSSQEQLIWVGLCFPCYISTWTSYPTLWDSNSSHNTYL